MKKYTLEEIENLSNAMYTLTHERWVHYTTTRFGLSKKEADDQYKILKDFPRKIKGNEAVLGRIIPVALELINELETCWGQSWFKNLKNHEDQEVRKLVYKDKNSEEVKEIIFDLHNAENIRTYAAMLGRGIETILLLRRCCNVSVKNQDEVSSKYVDVFEGDIFNTNDDWYGVKSNVFVAAKDGNFRKLLYIKGKGYLMNGDLNYEDGNYSSYVLTRECVKIGNIYLKEDLIKLTDNEQ